MIAKVVKTETSAVNLSVLTKNVVYSSAIGFVSDFYIFDFLLTLTLEMASSRKVVSFSVQCCINLIDAVVFCFFRDGEVEEAEKCYFVYVSGFVKAVFRLVRKR